MQNLYAPWRMCYIKNEDQRSDAGCPFCADLGDPDREPSLVVHRGPLTGIILNKFPYNTGHSLVMPRRHLGELDDLSTDELRDLMETVRLLTAAMRRTLNPSGFNVGLNLGKVAGAGIPGHLHVHVVPRWDGDHNFMPITAETHVLPELLPDTRRKLAVAIASLLAGK
jgi:ATP adenylyltransferase